MKLVLSVYKVLSRTQPTHPKPTSLRAPKSSWIPSALSAPPGDPAPYLVSCTSYSPLLVPCPPPSWTTSWSSSVASRLDVSHNHEPPLTTHSPQNHENHLSQSLFLLLLCLTTWGILVTPPGIEPVPPAVEAPSANHWTTREVPPSHFWLYHLLQIFTPGFTACRRMAKSHKVALQKEPQPKFPT